MSATQPQREPEPERRARATPPSPLVALEQVSVQFGNHLVLHDLNITVERGETAVVIGESGCGKTVLLKLIISLLRPTSGRILFDGRVLAELNERELTRQRLRFGFLFQGAALFDSLTVFENVAFGLREQGRHTEHEIEAIVRHRLGEVGMPAEVEPKKPAELSGGMKKMLYDEPTTGLDPIMSDVINELILQTRRRRPVTSIVVTHDMRTVQKVADRVIMLHPLARLGPSESQILFDGSPVELQRCPDTRVRQFVQGEAGERLREIARDGGINGF